jgi:RNA polymerase sigma factor (sigma-70 family)
MAQPQLRRILAHLRRWAGEQETQQMQDQHLLQRFASQRDEAAFAALMERHGPMVLHVCRRMLVDPNAAADAFQATFVLLVRKAGSISKRELLPSWLYGVAYRIAKRAQVERAKRLDREARVEPRQVTDAFTEITRRELSTILDDELSRLPDRYRAPFLLCFVEGQTRDQAAQQLGCSFRTLQRRLDQGRRLLRQRLTRRGVTLSATLLAGSLAQRARAAVPAALAAATRQAGMAVTGENAAITGTISESVAALAEHGLQALTLSRVKLGMLLVLALAALASGAGLLVNRSAPADPPQVVRDLAEPPRPDRPASPRPDEEPRPGVDRYGDPLPEQALARLGTVRLRHTGEVRSVALSPDNKLAASAGPRSTNVWDTATGRELDRFKGKIWCEEVAFSSDGKVLLAAGFNGVIQHWDVATGRLLPESERFSRADGLGVTAFSPDRKIVVRSDLASTGVLNDLATGKCLVRIQKAYAVMSIALSHDGKLLATGGQQDSLVHLWDAATGRELRQLRGHDQWIAHNWIFNVCFSPDDKLLASAGKDLRLWEVATGKQLLQLPHMGGRLAFSPDGKLLACGSKDTIHLLDVATGREIRRLKGHGSWLIPELAFSVDGKLLISGSRDHTVGLWDVATGKPLHAFPGHRGAVITLAFSPDGRSLASGGDEDHALIVWDLATRKPKHLLTDHNPWVLCAAYSPDGKFIVTGEGSNGSDEREAQVRWWDASDGKLVRQHFGHLSSVWSLSFSPDGKTLASTGWDARARLWDVATGKRLHQVRGASYEKRVAFAPDGKAFLVADSRGGTAIWDPATGQKLSDVGAAPDEGRSVFHAAFGPDGATVFTVETTTRLVQDHPQSPPRRERVPQACFWDRSTGRLLRSFLLADRKRSPEEFYSLALSPDGRILATGAADGSIQLVGDSRESRGFPPGTPSTACRPGKAGPALDRRSRR